MRDVKGNTLQIGDYVVFVHGKNSTASLKTGTITKIYQGRFFKAPRRKLRGVFVW